ncbi:uncharacterized protein [Penaeus vannamei]|uniref:uncharacterized protein n=1 Tax=Penaeus vannamei TaxID=6689 RepID=UPI00387FB07E
MAVHLVNGQIVSDPAEQLYQVDPPAVNLDAGSAEIRGPPISEDPPSLTEVMGAISQLKSGKAMGIRGVPTEPLKAVMEIGRGGCMLSYLPSGRLIPFPRTASITEASHCSVYKTVSSRFEPLIIGNIASLYTGTESTIKRGGGLSSFFPVSSGVSQGCDLEPTLFNLHGLDSG